MKYIAILRGINVSGQKQIKMADLKSLFESLNFDTVLTYIQSGNVIFNSIIKNRVEIKDLIEKAIQKKYTFQVPVIIRSNTEIKKILTKLPFKAIDVDRDGTIVLVAFLAETASKKAQQEIQQCVSSPEKLVIDNQNVYLYCPNGYGKSKLNNNFLEKKLAVTTTTRNLKTVHKLHELSL